MGMTVLVENKAGGNFIPAGNEVLSSPPDGHTLYFISSSSLITQALLSGLSVRPVEVRSGQRGVDRAADPGREKRSRRQIHEGTGRARQAKAGHAQVRRRRRHRQLARLRHGAAARRLADIKITIVPYRGAGPALNDLLGGHIDAMVDAMPVMSIQAKEGKVTPLAVTGTKRSSALPDVPTMQELGFKDFVVTGWYGILAPPGTPPAIVQKLRDEAAKAVAAGGRGQDAGLAGHGAARHAARRIRANTWRRNWRSTTRSSRTRTSSRNRLTPDRRPSCPASADGIVAAMCRGPRLDSVPNRVPCTCRPCPTYRAMQGICNALSRPLDRSLRRQFSLVERHPHPQGHGALWRRLAGGDGSRLREAARARGRAGPRQGLVRGMARARRSDREARRRGARQRPQDHRRRLLPARRHLSLQRRALHRARARRRRRSAPTPTRSGTRAFGCAIRTSSSSRCPTRAPPCPRCS